MAINLLNNSEVAGTLTIRADGTSSPSDSNKLIFKGIGDFGVEITRGEIQLLDDDVNPNGSNMSFKVSDDNGDLQTYLTIDGYGFVGINTATPSNTLEVNGSVKVGTTLNVGTINNASSDTDKFLVSDSGVLKYRTGAEVLSDIGAASSGSLASYLPLAGGTMTGNIALGDNDITGIDELIWTSGTKLGDDGNTQYLRLTYASTGGGGIVVKDGDNSVQGYLYADGQATSGFGLLDGSGSWAVRCIEDQYVQLRYDNSTKFQTSTTGVTITGTATATTFAGDLNGTINTATTATTQSASDNSTKVATTAYVDTAVSNAPQGTVTSVSATAPVTSTGGTTPTIAVDTAAVSSASSKLATGAQIQTAIESSVSGSSNRVAKFTADHVVGNSEIVDTGTSITMGKDTSAASTLYLDTDNRKVGFRTETPGSAFDVNGTTRVRNQLNVGHTTEQNLYVDGDGTAGGRYVKMGNYGSGNYFGITSSENQPKYCASFGSAGKIVEDMRIVTIKLSGNAFKLLKTTGTTLLAAPGSNSFIIPYECIIHNSGGTSGNWNSTSSTTAAIGFCDNTTCNYPGQFNRLFVINNTLLNTNAAWYYAAGIATTGKAMALNKPLLLKASQDITTAPTGSWYIQIRYQVMNKDSGLVNNVDITKTTN